MSKVHDSVKLRHGSAKIVLTIRYSQALWKHEDALGVSATHLDWTMVPYVRKSFRKHYTDGMKYSQSLVDNMPENHYAIEYFKWCDDNLVNDVSIEDEYYKECEVAYEYAMDMTEREVHQSAEAMYHNLNTLMNM